MNFMRGPWAAVQKLTDQAVLARVAESITNPSGKYTRASLAAIASMPRFC